MKAVIFFALAFTFTFTVKAQRCVGERKDTLHICNIKDSFLQSQYPSETETDNICYQNNHQCAVSPHCDKHKSSAEMNRLLIIMFFLYIFVTVIVKSYFSL